MKIFGEYFFKYHPANKHGSFKSKFSKGLFLRNILPIFLKTFISETIRLMDLVFLRIFFQRGFLETSDI